MAPWGLLIQGVANTISAGVTYAAGKKLQQAYEDYSNKVKELANEYSGSKAYDRMTTQGMEEANKVNRRAQDTAIANQHIQTGNSAMANANANANIEGAYEDGYNLGASNEQTKMQGEYNYNKAIADAQKEQAEREYKATMAAAGGIQKIGSTVAGMGLFGGSGGGTTASGGSGMVDGGSK